MASRFTPAAAPRVAPLAVPDASTAGDAARGVGELAGVGLDALRQQRQADERIADIEAQTAMRQRDDDDQRLVLAQSAELARITEWERVRALELKTTAGPGGAGYAETLATERAARLTQFDGAFGTNDRVRARFMEPLARFDARSGATAQIETMQAQATKAGGDYEAANETWLNTLRTGPTLATYQDLLGQNAAMLEGMTLWTAEQRAEARRQFVTAATHTLAEGMIAGGNDQALSQMLSAGLFNERLTPQGLENLQGQVASAGRARELAAEAAASDARRDVKARADSIKLRIGAGEMPEASEINGIVAEARAAGLPVDEVTAIELMAEDATVNRAYRNASPEMLAGQLATLQARDPATLPPEQQRLLQRLPEMIEARTDAEVEPMRETFRSGTQGRQAVATQLAAIADDGERTRRAEALEPGLSMLVSLPERYRVMSENGRALLAANPGQEIAPQRAVARAWAGHIGGDSRTGALRNRPDEEQAAVRDIARNLYLDWGGRFDARGEPTSPDAMRTAASAAVGGTIRNGVQHGGLATMRGATVVLPRDMTPQAFQRSLGSESFTNARFAGNITPTRSQIFNGTVPVFAGVDGLSTVYYLEGAGGARLLNADGGDYLFRVWNR